MERALSTAGAVAASPELSMTEAATGAVVGGVVGSRTGRVVVVGAAVVVVGGTVVVDVVGATVVVVVAGRVVDGDVVIMGAVVAGTATADVGAEDFLLPLSRRGSQTATPMRAAATTPMTAHRT
jgi:hypothetical protein